MRFLLERREAAAGGGDWGLGDRTHHASRMVVSNRSGEL
jgi:hypothetical protein